ncbi:hypothetical protein [Metabacillus arenae]|uniref:Uncharacterized protein n=1 Tax=Metabacillus arenae TaxID=2771434 RepID=A0A926N990_9BACI|nr:hypothetical protein [Metabacillus arenae]MBD1379079.1 hypothetical protein [Metabacillus arenae]
MKTNFFEELKKFVIDEHKDDKYFLQYIRYYETLLQNKDVLQPLLSDLENWKMDIHFENDKTEGYTYGKWLFYLWEYNGEEPNDEYDFFNCAYDQKSPDYYYEIKLTRDQRLWGFCQCIPDMELYNEKHECCGNGCDWTAPSFILSKVEEKYGKFKGKERDIWELEEKWSEYLESYDNKVKESKLKSIDEQIKRLEEEKNKFINK